jgi:ATP-dependent DNA ligase
MGTAPARSLKRRAGLGRASRRYSRHGGEVLRRQYEPKWDGFRCLVFKEASTAELRGKSGKALGRFFPEVIALLRDLPVERFVADGQLVIEIDGRLSRT